MSRYLPTGLEWNQVDRLWAQSLDQFVSNPLNNITLITDLDLEVGPNIINHGLGFLQRGWIVTDIDGIASIYRSAPFNNKTLELTSNAIVTISIGVF